MVNDIIWEYSEKTNNWNNVGKCTASLREGQIYYNESTKQTFYYTNGNAYCIGNGNQLNAIKFEFTIKDFSN